IQQNVSSASNPWASRIQSRALSSSNALKMTDAARGGGGLGALICGRTPLPAAPVATQDKSRVSQLMKRGSTGVVMQPVVSGGHWRVYKKGRQLGAALALQRLLLPRLGLVFRVGAVVRQSRPSAATLFEPPGRRGREPRSEPSHARSRL